MNGRDLTERLREHSSDVADVAPALALDLLAAAEEIELLRRELGAYRHPAP